MSIARAIFQGCALTDKGLSRARNEDSVGLHITPGADAALAVVADGVGGNPGGDIASKLAVEHLLAAAGAGLPQRRLDNWLRQAVLAANHGVRRQQGRNDAHAGMATTIIAMLARGNRIAVAHLGDSRAYRLRGGRLTALTVDHTVAQAMFEEGTYSREDLARSPYQHVLTRGLGLMDTPDCPSLLHVSEVGDQYLLCSDGLNKVLPERDIQRILTRQCSPQEHARALVTEANAAGGPDNITVALLQRTPKAED
ncbi:MAG: protein phosphatase 2C domain-containing protein [Aquisalimonadaceae bacterium]